MTDDNLDDTQQRLVQSKGYNDALKEGLEAVEKAVSVGKPIDVGKYYTYDEIALLSAVTKNVWNAAIEAAMKRLTLISGVTLANTIKDLKK